MRARRGSLAVGLLAAACATPFACTFLSDFPDVETEPGASTMSSTGTEAASTSGSGSESASTGGSTGSGTCVVPYCTGAACALDELETRVKFKTQGGDTWATSAGLTNHAGYIHAAISHKRELSVNDALGTDMVGAGPYELTQTIYRITGGTDLAARIYDCHVTGGGTDVAGFDGRGEQMILGIASAANDATPAVAKLTVDRSDTGDTCASGTEGKAFGTGFIVPFMVSFGETSGQNIEPARDQPLDAPMGVHAAFAAVASADGRAVALGVTPATYSIYGESGCDGGAQACHFVLDYDFSRGLPTVSVDMVKQWGEGGEFPTNWDPAAITIDDQGTIWAAGTRRTGVVADPSREIKIYRKRLMEDAVVVSSSVTNLARVRGIAAHGGVIYVAGDVDGPLTFGDVTRAAFGGRDVFVMAFDRTTFGPAASPMWIGPQAADTNGFDMTREDTASAIVVHQPESCAPSIYVAGCSATATGGCGPTKAGASALLFRFDDLGAIARATEIPATAGSLWGGHLAIDPAGDFIWMSFGMDDVALGQTVDPPAHPATVITRLPL